MRQLEQFVTAHFWWAGGCACARARLYSRSHVKLLISVKPELQAAQAVALPVRQVAQFLTVHAAGDR